MKGFCKRQTATAVKFEQSDTMWIRKLKLHMESPQIHFAGCRAKSRVWKCTFRSGYVRGPEQLRDITG